MCLILPSIHRKNKINTISSLFTIFISYFLCVPFVLIFCSLMETIFALFFLYKFLYVKKMSCPMQKKIISRTKFSPPLFYCMYWCFFEHSVYKSNINRFGRFVNICVSFLRFIDSQDQVGSIHYWRLVHYYLGWCCYYTHHSSIR